MHDFSSNNPKLQNTQMLIIKLVVKQLMASARCNNNMWK